MNPSDQEPDQNSDRTVCFCHCVPLSEIRKAIQAGAKTIADLQRETLASTGCGGCEIDLTEILEAEVSS